MRKIVTCLSALGLLLTSGCTAVTKDLRYPGGYPGYLLDRHSFNASRSKQLMLLRATIILAMAARMGHATVRGEDADAFAHYLAAASDEINYAAGDLASSCSAAQEFDSATADKCNGFIGNFESDMPLIEERVVRVMLGALPADRARKFLASAAKGDTLGAAWDALRAVASTIGGLHVAAGTYRSGLEAVAANAICASGQSFAPNAQTLTQAVQCLGLPDNIGDVAGSPIIPTNSKVQSGAFQAIFRIVNTACVDLPFTTQNGGRPLAELETERTNLCAAIAYEPAHRPFASKTRPDAAVVPAAVAAPAPPPAPIPVQ